jgi:hypothetical protein
LTVSVEAPVLGVTFASFTRGNVVTAMAFGKFEGEDALYIATGDNVYRVDPRGFVREMVFYPVANPLLPPTPT